MKGSVKVKDAGTVVGTKKINKKAHSKPKPHHSRRSSEFSPSQTPNSNHLLFVNTKNPKCHHNTNSTNDEFV